MSDPRPAEGAPAAEDRRPPAITRAEKVAAAAPPTTDRAVIEQRVARARRAADAGVPRPVEWREAQLKALRAMVLENRERFEQALWTDLRKNATEAQVTELSQVVAEVDHALKNLRSWMKPQRASLPLVLQPASARLEAEPLGTVLVIAPWNYPVQLLLVPVLGAIAAGNAVVLKPSEITPHVSALLAELVPQHLDPDAVQIVEGGVEETTALLEHRFDHIVFTGNGTVGRVVMRAAAEHLTPVTLELGGKSPLWFDDDAHLEEAARRFAWAKYLNAGQTCIAPDYVLTTPERVGPLAAAIERAIEALYGDAGTSPDFGRIVSPKQFDRTAAYIAQGEVLVGGQTQREDLFIAPTVLRMEQPADPAAERTEATTPAVLREEIFAPILPIVPVADVDAAIAYIRADEKPLALYVFTADDAVREALIARTSSGAVVDGAAILQAAAPTVPFGGVGESGMGSYHGQTSFERFSHRKPVVTKPYAPETLRMIMPPFSAAKRAIVRRVFGV
ncbi:aldehyde dehydrogenase family protein [Brachybacterium sp. JHP9]|uniref:Aldehyde dehydrogenase n=1 Tax=Brachybacterium equifaecis TaxID=2910770 RepID=A0ABT0R356_9MICO|nr:aldehyde dehydrogenase family protein [Brachybacterium equifaecis]MCL6424190.1 aldehyde dehydrogenase family protein [Brachybacterium equifaecis]